MRRRSMPELPPLGRGLGSPALFAIVWVALASAVLFSLGVVADNALGLTPVIFLGMGLFFGLAAMTYVEGASLHQDRAGSTVFARYAFNELVSFLAGWAILLDYVILVAVCAYCATHYAAAFWSPADEGTTALVLALGVVLYVATRNVLGFTRGRLTKLAALVVLDIALQLVLIVAGLVVFFDLDVLLDPIDLGTSPEWSDLLFAAGVATVVLTGLESASGLSGEVAVGRRGLKRLVSTLGVSVLVVYVGTALVAVTAVPVVDGRTALAGEHLEAPLIGITEAFEQAWISDGLKYVLAAAATATLIAAANSAMMGVSRLAYSLSRNRQIPSALGRLHRTRSTPYVLIVIAAVLAGALVVPEDLELLVGIYAFGALLGLTIAHLSVIVLRVRDPGRDRPYRIPFNVVVRGTPIPVPAVLGALASTLVLLSVVVFHEGARYVGLGWMGGGLLLYVVYRYSQEKPLLRRVVVEEEDLRGLHAAELEFASILVPLTGTPIDDDIIQTAGRLAGGQGEAELDEAEQLPTIEAIWVLEVPMALPLDARLPDAQLQKGREALRRAKDVGEEYEGVVVRTATVRSRRSGSAIIEEARRRGVQAIVMAAEAPSRIRGGAAFGGRALEGRFAGEITRYVVAKAPCPVILTAAPVEEVPAP
ncbi:MAG TPA: amino acid permease, partial [Baekduia sp.]|nr:amino acid permease [Baekduia sp.]